ncbi:MAG: YqgE/AlgH family protein [Saprospiraceae bacterium]|jgi:putative transcriptional regulator|nr:YqgE/AlgH family protein [Saprospiraceae bacterium]
MGGKIKIEAGQILIAEPFLEDPHFQRSVILLTEHYEENGTIGLVLNKPLRAKINELVVDFPEIDAQMYYGGPVANDTLHYVHNVGDLLEESIPILRGLYWGGNFEKLKFLIDKQLIGPENIRFFAGYSGWASGQLDEELNIGSWITSEGDSNYIFKVHHSKLWKRILDDKGHTYSVISELPDQMTWN